MYSDLVVKSPPRQGREGYRYICAYALLAMTSALAYFARAPSLSRARRLR